MAKTRHISVCNHWGNIYSRPVTPVAIFRSFGSTATVRLAIMTDNFQSVGNGTGPNPDRQEGPHAHQILTDLDGNHVFGVDLGADKVNVWNLDSGAGTLI